MSVSQNILMVFVLVCSLEGINIKKDQATLKDICPHIVVGTPGRILALIREKSLNLKGIKHFILDKCDTMFDQLGRLPDW